MSFEYTNRIPLPEEIKAQMPVSDDVVAIKKSRDREIRDVLEGASDKFLVIIGPCSAHDEDAVCEYVSRLARIDERTRERLVLVPRIYTNKPRTLGTGYKGMLHQPDPRKQPDIVEGIKALRRLHIRAIRDSGLTAADEMLYPTNHPYLDDLLSYVAVGARSVENQQHRLTASGVDIPVGMKNPLSGDLAIMLNSIQAARNSHVFTYNGWEVRTSGNPHAHAILRGALDRFANSIPNYHYEDLVEVARLFEERELVKAAVIVDINHSNSGKKYAEQPRVATEVIGSRKNSSVIHGLVRGLMIESFLVEGAQGPDGDVFGQSITDPCLGWEQTERLLETIAAMV